MKTYLIRFSIVVVLLFLAGYFVPHLYAQTDQSSATQDALQQQIQEYQNKLNDIRSTKNTLSSQIQYMDTQINLINLQIQQTTQNIAQLEKEIELINQRTENLDSSINALSKLMLQRIVASYKAKDTGIWELLFDSNNIDQMMNTYKYYKSAQEYNQKLLVQVQTAKTNFEEQKQLREKKKVELDALQVQLNNQNDQIEKQKAAKKQLLQDTQNNENIYQQLLARARAQLAAFKSFVQSSGADSIISPNGLGTGPDGNYFSQRDSRWAYQVIGYSSENILNVGCLITSIAMVLKKAGINTNPSIIASTPEYFDGNTANMKYRYQINWPNGLKGYNISSSQVDNELNNGHYVIVGINYGPCETNSDHFVVLTKKDGNDYKMYDPLYGPDLNFSSHYSQVCYAEVIR